MVAVLMLRALALGLAALTLGCTAPPAVATGTPAVTRPLATSSATATTGATLPLFDAHVHYSEPAWSLLTADQAIARLREAGIRRAIVSSSPDAGTMRLYERAPDVVVPFLRPYRGEVGPGTWTRDGTTVAYLEATYRRGVHRGIGELHFSAGESGLPVVRAVVEMAVREGIWLQVHTDARGIDELLRAGASRTRVLWAHAGQFASPAEVRALVERYPTMWVELAGRGDIATADGIDPAWREVFLAHPARFLVGSDTWINPQWERLVEIHATTQRWLAALPPEVARRIATGNAEELFPAR